MSDAARASPCAVLQVEGFDGGMSQTDMTPACEVQVRRGSAVKTARPSR